MKVYKIITTFATGTKATDYAVQDNHGNLIRGERRGPVGVDQWEWQFTPGSFGGGNNCRNVYLSQADLDAAEVVEYDAEKDGY